LTDTIDTHAEPVSPLPCLPQKSIPLRRDLATSYPTFQFLSNFWVRPASTLPFHSDRSTVNLTLFVPIYGVEVNKDTKGVSRLIPARTVESTSSYSMFPLGLNLYSVSIRISQLRYETDGRVDNAHIPCQSLVAEVQMPLPPLLTCI
jgi:hypothetical protein